VAIYEVVFLIQRCSIPRPDANGVGLDRRELEIQLQLLYDYRTNALYPAFQAFFRQYKPPTLIVWGRTTPSSSHRRLCHTNGISRRPASSH